MEAVYQALTRKDLELLRAVCLQGDSTVLCMVLTQQNLVGGLTASRCLDSNGGGVKAQLRTHPRSEQLQKGGWV